MTSEIIELATQWETEDLWKHFTMLFHDGGIDENLYDGIKNGFNVKVDIREVIHFDNGEPTSIFEKPKNHIIIVNKKRYELKEYWDEIDKRTALMRKIIIDHYLNKDQTEARIK